MDTHRDHAGKKETVMKRSWKLFLGAGAVSIAATAATAIVGARNAGRQAKIIAETTITDVTANWSDRPLLDHASPEFLQSVDVSVLNKSFANLSQSLGHMTKFGGLSGQPNYNFSIGDTNSATATATYSGDAEFEHGKVNFEVDLIRHESAWQIKAFHINMR
jgi:hypothetical protein